MKKLFETDRGISIAVPEDGKVFRCCDYQRKKLFYLGSNGEEISYCPAPRAEDPFDWEGEYSDDPEGVDPVCEGVYSYTTQPYENDVDGNYGTFGFKDIEGHIIIPEQYYEVRQFHNGLCSVRMKDGEWGCIDKQGKTVISFKYHSPVEFNIYGIAQGNGELIDLHENIIPDTKMNCYDSYGPDERYYFLSRTTEEQFEQIDRNCGHADHMTVSIFDTKTLQYLVRDIPDSKLYIYGDHVEPEVIIQAASMLNEYDRIIVEGRGTIITEKGKVRTVFDYYR